VRALSGPPVRDASFIELRGVCKRFDSPSGGVAALLDIDLGIEAGERVAIVGRSGSGKTTLLNLLTGIDRSSGGTIVVGGEPVHTLSEERLARWRGRSVGIVFQFFHLVQTLTVVENVMLPMDFAGVMPPRGRKARAESLLERLGIEAQARKLPADLSAGQQQRAAIARALANDPPLIVADEPTGNLDSTTADEVMALLSSLATDGMTVIAVTHERDVGRFFPRVVSLKDGRIQADSPRASRPAVGC
jgi:putative ABC transport system ATP-binding protein